MRFAKSGFFGFLALNSGKIEKKGRFSKKACALFRQKTTFFGPPKKVSKTDTFRRQNVTFWTGFVKYRQNRRFVTFSDETQQNICFQCRKLKIYMFFTIFYKKKNSFLCFYINSKFSQVTIFDFIRKI